MPSRALRQNEWQTLRGAAVESESINALAGITTQYFQSDATGFPSMIRINKCPRGHYDPTRKNVLPTVPQFIRINKCPRGHYDLLAALTVGRYTTDQNQ